MLVRLDQRAFQHRKAGFILLYVGSDQQWFYARRKILKSREYHIVSCADRESAVRFLKGEPVYDLLLFELELRGTGLELASLARSLSHREQLPILILAEEGVAAPIRWNSRAKLERTNA